VKIPWWLLKRLATQLKGRLKTCFRFFRRPFWYWAGHFNAARTFAIILPIAVYYMRCSIAAVYMVEGKNRDAH